MRPWLQENIVMIAWPLEPMRTLGCPGRFSTKCSGLACASPKMQPLVCTFPPPSFWPSNQNRAPVWPTGRRLGYHRASPTPHMFGWPPTTQQCCGWCIAVGTRSPAQEKNWFIRSAQCKVTGHPSTTTSQAQRCWYFIDIFLNDMFSFLLINQLAHDAST